MPSIILASDSRISDGYHASSNREQKIISVMFNGDHCVLLAKAGIKTTADAFEEKFSEIAANTAIKTPRSVADAAEVAMRDVLARLNAGYTGDIDRRIADYESQFIMGFWHQGKPYFYTIGLQSRLATLRLPRFSGHAG
jgi:20S proteasome alpha/beta subunit